MSTEPLGSLTSGVPHQSATVAARARQDGEDLVVSVVEGPAGAVAPDRDPALPRVLPARDLVAIVLAGTGALLVFVSLLVDWQRITMPGTAPVNVGIADIPTWGTVYVLCAMMLIAVFVCVVALPVTFGATARVLGISWALGVAAIIVAMLVRLTDVPAVSEGSLMRGLLDGLTDAEAVRTSWGSGIVYAAISVVMLMGAFITACPPLRDGGVCQNPDQRP